jgi:hypothetical protein
LIPVKRVFDRIFKNVNSEKDFPLSENQLLSEPFNKLQTNPSESQTNTVCNDAAQATTSTAPVIHSMDEDEDSDRTLSPPPKENQPEDDAQNKPQTPPLENDQNKPPPSPPVAEQTNPTPESVKSPEPNSQINPDSEAAQNSPVINVEKSPHHVAMDNTIIAELFKTPPHHTNPNTLMQTLSDDCIYVPPSLPSRILNEPMDETKEDITKMLKAVDKNIRRIQNAIPNRSIESAEIDKECELMEIGLQNMLRAIRESYKRDLELRKELARLEAEKIEQEKREAEERERKR